jgi:hypothetical protein
VFASFHWPVYFRLAHEPDVAYSCPNGLYCVTYAQFPTASLVARTLPRGSWWRYEVVPETVRATKRPEA